MRKFVYFLVAVLVSIDAEKLNGKYEITDILEPHKMEKIATFKKSGKSGSIHWNTNIILGYPPIKAVLQAKDKDGDIVETINVKDLCADQGKNTGQASVQQIALKLISNSNKCPIAKGTTVNLPPEFRYETSTLKAGSYKFEVCLMAPVSGGPDAEFLTVKINGKIGE